MPFSQLSPMMGNIQEAIRQARAAVGGREPTPAEVQRFYQSIRTQPTSLMDSGPYNADGTLARDGRASNYRFTGNAGNDIEAIRKLHPREQQGAANLFKDFYKISQRTTSDSEGEEKTFFGRFFAGDEGEQFRPESEEVTSFLNSPAITGKGATILPNDPSKLWSPYKLMDSSVADPAGGFLSNYDEMRDWANSHRDRLSSFLAQYGPAIMGSIVMGPAGIAGSHAAAVGAGSLGSAFNSVLRGLGSTGADASWGVNARDAVDAAYPDLAMDTATNTITGGVGAGVGATAAGAAGLGASVLNSLGNEAADVDMDADDLDNYRGTTTDTGTGANVDINADEQDNSRNTASGVDMTADERDNMRRQVDDISRRFAGDPVRLAGALYDLYNTYRNSGRLSDLQDELRAFLNRSDPFAPGRADALSQYRQYLGNPSSYLNSPLARMQFDELNRQMRAKQSGLGYTWNLDSAGNVQGSGTGLKDYMNLFQTNMANQYEGMLSNRANQAGAALFPNSAYVTGMGNTVGAINQNSQNQAGNIGRLFREADALFPEIRNAANSVFQGVRNNWWGA